MKELLEQGLIVELPGTQNVQYVFKDSNLFSLTEYKVLRNQNSSFIKCSKVIYNGEIKLVYFSAGLKSLKHMLPTLDLDTFLVIISNVLTCAIEIQNNGFLSCNDLDLSLDKIFVNQNTLAVSLIYLPLNNSDTDTAVFENDLRSETIKLITGSPAFAGEKAKRVCSYLASGTFKLADINSSIKKEITLVSRGSAGGTGAFGGSNSNPANIAGQPVLIFSSLNAATPLRFTIQSSEFVIGKSAAKVNGVITFNQAISRVHCKITYQNGHYFITDLGSANGTFVNKKRIAPHQSRELESSDVIRLANSDFKVEF